MAGQNLMEKVHVDIFLFNAWSTLGIMRQPDGIIKLTQLSISLQMCQFEFVWINENSIARVDGPQTEHQPALNSMELERAKDRP